jgi:hypothetical protein
MRSAAPACLGTNRELAESGIPGGSINVRLRLEHLKRARHLDSCWFAQLEMGDQPLLADIMSRALIQVISDSNEERF